jgi:mannose-1-phosphate guanylyltransferase
LTDRWPKPLLRFFDRPIVSLAADALLSGGVDNAGFNAHAHAAQMVAWRDSYVPTNHARLAPRFTMVEEPELLGTGGGAKGIWHGMGEPAGVAIVMNGDVVCDLPIEAMMQTHRRTGAVATLLTIPVISGEAAIHLDETRRFVTRLPLSGGEAEAPGRASAYPASFAGVYIIDSKVLAQLPAGKACLIRQGLAPLLRSGATIAAHPHNGFWADLGTPARFIAATSAILDAPERYPLLRLPHRSNQIWNESTRGVHPRARLIGPVYIAPGAVVDADAEVGPYSVVGAGCVVESGAHVRNSVLMNNAHVTVRAERQILSGPTSARAV